MENKKDIGNKGEEIAVAYLVNKGYQILEKNFRYGRAEIDIIAKFREIVIFIEVKNRFSDNFGLPEDFVTKGKIKMMSEGAEGYLEKHNLDCECRYDIVAILYGTGKPQIEHIEDAFWPGVF
jgi:putative endonuclease